MSSCTYSVGSIDNVGNLCIVGTVSRGISEVKNSSVGIVGNVYMVGTIGRNISRTYIDSVGNVCVVGTIGRSQ